MATNRGRLLFEGGSYYFQWVLVHGLNVITLSTAVPRMKKYIQIIATVLYWPCCVYSSTAYGFHVYKHPWTPQIGRAHMHCYCTAHRMTYSIWTGATIWGRLLFICAQSTCGCYSRAATIRGGATIRVNTVCPSCKVLSYEQCCFL